MKKYFWAGLCMIMFNQGYASNIEIKSNILLNNQKISLPWQTLLQKTRNSLYVSDFEKLLEDFFIETMSCDLLQLTNTGLFESIGVRDHNAFLNDMSPEMAHEFLNIHKDFLQQLYIYELDTLSGDDQASYEFFNWALKHAIEGEPFLFHGYKVNQMCGALFELNLLMTQFHQLEVPQDVDNYISRLQRIPEYLRQVIRFLEHQESLGIVLPSCAREKVSGIIKASTPENISDNAFYKYLSQNIEGIDGIDNDRALAQAANIIIHCIYPAYQELFDFYACQQKKYSANDGVWALPCGDEYYQYMLKHHTTTNLSADEVHEIGLREVAHIHEQMRQLLALEGLTEINKTVGELMQEYSHDDSFFYEQTEEGCKQCLADFEKILIRCRQELHPLFDVKPSALVKILPVPVHEQEGAPGAYYCHPSADGSRPGIFFVNLRDMKEVPRYGMETLAVHEAEPGHHFQLALQQSLDIPMLRKMSKDDTYTAYIEGWALYTEKLAYEHNFYSSTASKLGHFQDELLRAVRLVVDTGIHKKRWSRDYAIDYMVNATGYHRNTVITEVDRYFVLPGQACAYKIGQLKILELRRRAIETLGSKFNIRDFHNVVLKLGAAPLEMLETAVERYIEINLTTDCL